MQILIASWYATWNLVNALSKWKQAFWILVSKNQKLKIYLFGCVFGDCSLIWRHHHCRLRASKFELCSILMVIEQWGFLSCDTEHPFIMVAPRTRDIHTCFLAVELSLPVFTTLFCRGWDSNTQPAACDANALAHCATVAVVINLKLCTNILIHFQIYTLGILLPYVYFFKSYFLKIRPIGHNHLQTLVQNSATNLTCPNFCYNDMSFQRLNSN